MVHFTIVAAALFVGDRLLASGGVASRPALVVRVAEGASDDAVRRAVDEAVLVDVGTALGWPATDPFIRARLVEGLRFARPELAARPEAELVGEALALGMAERDPVIRRRLAERALREVDRRALRDPTEAEQAAWFASHAADYERPARVRFAQVFVSRERRGARADADAVALLSRLRAESPAPDEAARLGDPLLIARGVESANLVDLDKTYGAGFGQALAAAPLDTWSGPYPSSYGLHLVRVLAHVPARTPTLAQVRAAVRGAWRAAHREQARAAQLATLRAARDVVVERVP
ncbi:MAG: hypothetical protein CVU56_13185 [Deltaproteobacteria bacterium HGW-Deltaproteobacteria-14]|nr:MAG: hypothetical protein CVU56_13185 [Deltaproteobacteria bacterium HGW-Deltaproteobacteria-14]